MRWSVIIIAHNRPDFLAEALGSVAAQTLPAAEVIVVDDGSTTDLAPALSGHDDLPLTLIRQDNAGQQAARNCGAAAASGDWLVFLDDDDAFEPGHLAALAGALNEASPALIFANFRRFEHGEGEPDSFYARFPQRFPPEQLVKGGYRHLPRWPLSDHAELSILYPSTMAVRRDHFAAIGGFDTRMRGIKCEDMEFTARATYAHPLTLSLEPTVRYRMHSGNSVGDPRRREIGRFRIWQHLRSELPLQPADAAFLDALIAERAPHAFRAAFLTRDAQTLAGAARLMNPRERRRPKRWLRSAYARLAFPPAR